jgi:hypothetical protein
MASSAALASPTSSFQIDDLKSFAAGELRSAAAHSTGVVTPSVGLRRIAVPEVGFVYCMTQSTGGVTWLGTGNPAKVYRLSGDKAAMVVDTKQAIISAMAADTDGGVFAAAAPNGVIYRISKTGAVQTWHTLSKDTHVWSMVYLPRTRTLLLGTGPKGEILAVGADRTTRVWARTGDLHVMSMLLLSDESVLAGTAHEALLLKISPRGAVQVLHDFPGDEVDAIAHRQGDVVVVVNDFRGGDKESSDTRTDTKSESRPPSAMLPPKERPAGRGSGGKGRVWRLSASGWVEQVFRQDDAHFTALHLAHDGAIFVGSAKDGRVFRVLADRSYAVWAEAGERQVLALNGLQGPHSEWMFATGDAAAVYVAEPRFHRAPEWVSKPLDARYVSQWGMVTWRGTSGLRVQTRSGNTSKPDDRWSAWETPRDKPFKVTSPHGRFIQIKALFPPRRDAMLRSMTLYYSPQNQRAMVTEIATKCSGAKCKITWKVDNPDGDGLRYRLSYRADDQLAWRAITPPAEPLTALEYTWDTSSVADAYYVVRVDASDDTTQPSSRALSSTQDSSPFLVDNHAPQVQLRVQGAAIEGVVRDTASAPSKIEVAVDGGEWKPVQPLDGVLDEWVERFRLVLPQDGSSHVVAVRAADTAGNLGAAEVVLAGRNP